MSANIRSVEVLTSRSGSLTAELSDRGTAGATAVADSGDAIAAVKAAADDVLKTLGSLSKIAGDTNLLAMNAAIEAAHAGERGAGFAVVADEVRSLAQNAARQTKAIKDLVVAMYERVRRGVESSGASGEAIRSLSGGIGQAAAISLQIADAMKEQAAGTKSVEEALAQTVEASDSIKASMGEQVAETDRMAESLDLALRRLTDLAASSRAQADAVSALEASFAAVRKEVDKNLAAVEDLDKLLEGFKV
jgi:methyl-accepting chemotaxis protein